MKVRRTHSIRNDEFFVNVLSIYNAYNMIMAAIKRIPVSEPVWKKLGEMKGAGQTYDDLLEDMIERVKKARLEEDVKMWESRPDSEYVSLSEIKD
jgi:predicted CopG family antitoxin